MKRIIIIAIIIITLVGACTVTLLYNKKKIDEKARMDGNLKAIPVFVTEVKKTTLSGDFQANGSFSAIHEVTLMSEGQGKVEQLLFSTGDFVSLGQVLAKLDDDLLSSQLSLAEAALDKARKDVRKYEDLLDDDAISSQQVEDAKLGLKKAETDVATLRKQIDFTSVKAPIQGTVTKRYIERGSLVMPGTPVADIVDISRLKLTANVTESEAVRIVKGQKVIVTSSVYPGIEYSGTVVSVGVKADDARRFPVEIEIVNNPKNSLRAGMFGVARFSSDETREALVVPRHSLVGSIREPRVFIVKNDTALLRDIRIGRSNDHEVEILEGLSESDIVVTSGQINLDNNKPVIIVNKR